MKVADGYIVVEGKHNEKKDEHGFVARHFTRRYTCPKEADFEKIVSSLSSDGVLTVTVPKKVNFNLIVLVLYSLTIGQNIINRQLILDRRWCW